MQCVLADSNQQRNTADNHNHRYDDMPSFFVTAYEDVTRHPAGWWWSQQLLMWVIPACTFMPLHSRRIGLPPAVPWLVIAAGFLGAISLAFPFFFVAAWICGGWSASSSQARSAYSHSPSPSSSSALSADGGIDAGADHRAAPTTSRRVRLLVVATTVVATANVLALPATYNVSSAAYVFHLACLHAILAVPTLAVAIEGESSSTRRNSGNHNSSSSSSSNDDDKQRRQRRQRTSKAEQCENKSKYSTVLIAEGRKEGRRPVWMFVFCSLNICVVHCSVGGQVSSAPGGFVCWWVKPRFLC